MASLVTADLEGSGAPSGESGTLPLPKEGDSADGDEEGEEVVFETQWHLGVRHRRAARGGVRQPDLQALPLRRTQPSELRVADAREGRP